MSIFSYRIEEKAFIFSSRWFYAYCWSRLNTWFLRSCYSQRHTTCFQSQPCRRTKNKWLDNKLLTESQSIDLKNGWLTMSMNAFSRAHPNRSTGFLSRNAFRTVAAFTLNDRGIRMVFSKITWNKKSSVFCWKWVENQRKIKPIETLNNNCGRVTHNACIISIYFVYLIGIFRSASNVKRTAPSQHFIQQHTQSPPIDRKSYLISTEKFQKRFGQYLGWWCKNTIH